MIHLPAADSRLAETQYANVKRAQDLADALFCRRSGVRSSRRSRREDAAPGSPGRDRAAEPHDRRYPRRIRTALPHHRDGPKHGRREPAVVERPNVEKEAIVLLLSESGCGLTPSLPACV